MKKAIEILAPAGSYDGMRAAMNAGCDAVYIGGSNFGARAYADNPDEDMLLRAIDEAHIRDKKLYLTVNTLLKEKELTGELYRFLEKFYLHGLDAVIVQDVGVMHFIHRHFPGLAIHASTQMTLTMAQGANLLKDNGVTRIVTSRELNLKEIKAIRDNTDLEIETFVHGALCYSYSGQCLMSSIIGGRSGNRGRCAQPCRMPYQFYSEDKQLSSKQERYLLSPKDINTLAIIPDLVDAGIDSFKIEGRMKRPEYAAATSFLYRKYVDHYLELGRDGYSKLLESDDFRKDMLTLQDIYNRGGFSQGYGKTHHGKDMMSLYRPNHSGVLIGEVKELKGSQVGILLKEEINAQDILEIIQTQEEGYEFTVKDPHRIGDILWTNVGRSPVIKIGDQVYRTKNNELLNGLTKDYLEKNKKIAIIGTLSAKAGERIALTVSYGGNKVTAYQDVVMIAQKQPMTKDKLTAPILKTGDTLYYFDDLTIEADENIFVPVAWLNELRREAIQLLQENVVQSYRRNKEVYLESNLIAGTETLIVPKTVYSKSYDNVKASGVGKDTLGITVSVQTIEQLKAALSFPEVTAIYADYDTISACDIVQIAKDISEEGKELYLSLPHICRLSIYERLKKDLVEITGIDEVRGFIVKNFEEIAILQSLLSNNETNKEIILNYNMYTMNREAIAFWKEKGITQFTAPVELNYQELKTLGLTSCGMLVYGYLPLMVSAQCLYESTKGCRKQFDGDTKSNRNSYSGFLTDRLGKKFFVSTNCSGCYNIIYNGQALALHKQVEEILGLNPENIRLDFSRESTADMRKILTVFIERFRYSRMDTQEIPDYTTGHFKRGVE